MANVGQSVLWEVRVHAGDKGGEHLELAADVFWAVEELVEGGCRQVASLEQVGCDATAEDLLSRHGVGPIFNGAEEGVLPVGVQRGQPQRDRRGCAVPFGKGSGRASRS